MADINLLVSVGVPVIASLLTYAGVRFQYKSDLKKQASLNSTELEKIRKQSETEIEKVRRQSETEIQKIKTQCDHELEKIRIELEHQGKLYEQNAQTDLTKEIMSSLFNDPSKLDEKMKTLKKLESMFLPKK